MAGHWENGEPVRGTFVRKDVHHVFRWSGAGKVARRVALAATSAMTCFRRTEAVARLLATS